MSKRKLSDEAWELVEDTSARMVQNGPGVTWKMVALVIAEALVKTDADYQSLLIADYSPDEPTTRTKEYLAEAIVEILGGKHE